MSKAEELLACIYLFQKRFEYIMEPGNDSNDTLKCRKKNQTDMDIGNSFVLMAGGSRSYRNSAS